MTTNRYQAIAYHGWGFNPEFWGPLKSHFENVLPFKRANRGYFSEPENPVWDTSSDTEKLLLLHSYGVHWCDKTVLQQADHVVILCGFLHFHPRNEEDRKRSKLYLRKMQSQFVDAPDKVLQKFYQRVFEPERVQLTVPGNLRHDLLLSDLSDLDHDNRNNANLFDSNSITIIHGELDKIVTNEVARDMYSKLRLRSQYFEIKNAGHALPYTHNSQVFEILDSLLQFNQ